MVLIFNSLLKKKTKKLSYAPHSSPASRPGMTPASRSVSSRFSPLFSRVPTSPVPLHNPRILDSNPQILDSDPWSPDSDIWDCSQIYLDFIECVYGFQISYLWIPDCKGRFSRIPNSFTQGSNLFKAADTDRLTVQSI